MARKQSEWKLLEFQSGEVTAYAFADDHAYCRLLFHRRERIIFMDGEYRSSLFLRPFRAFWTLA